jgi:hypothetical protein
VWWGGSWWVSNKQESRLRAKLTEHGLQDRVHWKSLNGSLFGSFTLEDVVVDMPGQGKVQAGSVRVSDVVNSDDRQRLALRVQGLRQTDVKGEQAMAQMLGALSGRFELPPMDVELKVDARYDDDEGEIQLSLRQKEAVDFDFHLELTQIKVLREMGQAAGAAGQAGLGSMGGMGGMGLFALLALGEQVQLKSLQSSVKDRGAVERGIALYKRHNVPVSVDGGSLASQRDKGFAQRVLDIKAGCMREGPALLSKDPKGSCDAVTEFLSGKEDSLRVSIQPKTPMPISKAAEALMGRGGRPGEGAALLNVQIGS